MTNGRQGARAALFALASGLLYGLLGCGLLGCGEVRSADGPPNVVLVSFDTTRADHLSCYGYGRETSPTIDRLAAQGVLFENAVSHSPKTAPSHMSILTGLLPDAHGVRNLADEGNHALRDGVPTLATILRDAGYRTAAFTAGGHVAAELGFDRGFETFETGGGVEGIFERGAEAAEDFSGDPFFLFLHTYEVHDPYVPPQRYREMFADPAYDGRIIGSRDELKEASGSEWKKQHEVFWDHVDPSSERDVEHLKALYDAGIRYADDVLGDFLEELDELGELERTWVVFLSDHGEEFHEHGGFLHETLYQEVLRVPLIVRPPATLDVDWAGREIAQPVALIDVLPTVLELLGLPATPGAQGRSLATLIARGEGGASSVLSHWPRQGRYAFQREGWKLHWDETKDAYELYELAQDPGETRDLVGDQGALRDDLAGQLRSLRAWSRDVAAQGPRGEALPLTPEKRDELQALGYLGGEGTSEPDGADQR